MARPSTAPIVLMDEVVASGQSRPFNTSGYEFIKIIILATGTATGVIKILATDLNADDVDFTAPISATNEYELVALKDLLAGTVKAGGTGIVFAAAAAVVVRRIEINDNFARNIAIDLSGYSAGKFTVKVIGVRADAF